MVCLQLRWLKIAHSLLSIHVGNLVEFANVWLHLVLGGHCVGCYVRVELRVFGGRKGLLSIVLGFVPVGFGEWETYGGTSESGHKTCLLC